ncbi:Ohr family peroxiredoxin [Caulobacter hibisci]|uniref:Ohr family peroxiredoxin n=1 Tax=Caulobacter hibisci TaxID=2035993 RepID=A0ABS0T4Q1_9CAUL|nr:Ohr family peroxiredoxin [Caulobacter hibisci]MBI1686736.1 Ohr family peroxiredoxin [Caulobacter hibisci]
MTQAQTLYTGKVHVVGGREGAARSADGRLDIKLSTPGGPGGGTNPEQLLAAGWSACFQGAMAIAARQMGVTLTEVAIDAEIDLNTDGAGYFLAARMNVSTPGLAPDIAQQVVEAAHRTCPYSKALQGNIDVVLNLV